MKGRKLLIREIERTRNEIGSAVNERLKKFEKNRDLDEEEIFLELCFCILVANNSIERVQEAWKRIGRGFLRLPPRELGKRLKECGVRFYNRRAEFIVDARKKRAELVKIIREKRDENNIREWLVKNVKGIGWKEASHFLRNLGFKNFALLDRHVLKILKAYGIVEEIDSGGLSKGRYMSIEKTLRSIAAELNMSLAELDMYLFYLDAKRVCER